MLILLLNNYYIVIYCLFLSNIVESKLTESESPYIPLILYLPSKYLNIVVIANLAKNVIESAIYILKNL